MVFFRNLLTFLALLSIIYYFIFYLPSQQKQKDEEEVFLKKQLESRYHACLDSADSNATALWDEDCSELCIRNGGTVQTCFGKVTCNFLPPTMKNEMSENLEKDKKRCLEEFKAGIVFN